MHVFNDDSGLIEHILRAIHERTRNENVFPGDILESSSSSAVLFLLGRHYDKRRFDPCLILNKRSWEVKQPGDLCCPGGSIAPRIDSFFSTLLPLPFFPLGRWPFWSHWRRKHPQEARRLSLLFATSLRESFEEMRLNPLGVKFLGPLPSQRLTMFRRVIYPMVGWISYQKRFVTNVEVEKVVYIPLRNLLNPDNYGCYRLHINFSGEKEKNQRIDDFPCFQHKNHKESELLWGATYRIVTEFLEIVFGFKPPATLSLPVFHGILDENYINGSR